MIINRRPCLILIVLVFFSMAFMTFYFRVKSLHQLEVQLQLTVLPYTRKSFNTLVQTSAFMRANGHNILAYCDYEQEHDTDNPMYLATFSRRRHHEDFSYSDDDPSPLILDVYAHSNIRHVTVNQTQTHIVVFITSSPLQKGEENLSIENRIEQFDIASTIGYIDTFCMQFSRKTFGGYTYFIA